jgi:hypothetical protein
MGSVLRACELHSHIAMANLLLRPGQYNAKRQRTVLSRIGPLSVRVAEAQTLYRPYAPEVAKRGICG